MTKTVVDLEKVRADAFKRAEDDDKAQKQSTKQVSQKQILDTGGGVGTKTLNGRTVSTTYYEACENAGKLFRDLSNGKIREAVAGKQQTLGNDADGGYLVPEVVEQAIQELKHELPGLAQLIDRHPQNTDTLKVNIEDGSVSANLTNEDTAIGESKATFRQVTLTAYFIAALNVQTNRLLRFSQSIPSLGDYIMRQISRILRRTEEQYLWQGSGSNQPTGVQSELKATGSKINFVTASQVGNGQVNGGISTKDLYKLIYAIQVQWAENMAIFCRRDIMPHLANLQSGENGYRAFAPAGSLGSTNTGAGNGAVGHLLGIPVYNTSFIRNNLSLPGVTASKGSALVVMDTQEAMMAGDFAGDLRIDTSEHAEFKQDNTVIRGVAPICQGNPQRRGVRPRQRPNQHHRGHQVGGQQLPQRELVRRS